MSEPIALDPSDAAKKPRGRAALKDMIPLRTYTIPESMPKEIKFSSHMVRFTGFAPFQAAKDLIWGVQGTTSTNSADGYASRDAQHLKRRVYQVELLYRLKGLPHAGMSVTEAFARENGYAHFSRITSDFRKVLRERMLGWLQEARDPEYDRLADFEFEDLVKQRPMLIHKLMSVDKHLNAVIHPVLLSGGVSLRIGTVRNNPENIFKVFTRSYDEIVTTV